MESNLLPSYEIWVWIPGFEGRYEISNRGNVRSWIAVGGRSKKTKGTYRFISNPNPKKVHVDWHGYYVFNLGQKSKGDFKNVRVHRMVGILFVPNPENKTEVNHMDGDKSNNEWCNFEWNTRVENIGHAFRTGLIRLVLGELQGKAKLKNEQVLEIFQSTEPRGVLAARFGIHKDTIYNIKKGRIWSHITGAERYFKPSELKKMKYKKANYNDTINNV